MTSSTFDVAVCCSSDSVSSRVRCCSFNSRAFSIAITAWSAKIVTSSICLSLNGFTSCALIRKRRSAHPRAGAARRASVRTAESLVASAKAYSGSF